MGEIRETPQVGAQANGDGPLQTLVVTETGAENITRFPAMNSV